MAATDPQQTQDMLQGLVTDVGNAVETLRELARGIYPAVLADLGLAAASRRRRGARHWPSRSTRTRFTATRRR